MNQEKESHSRKGEKDTTSPESSKRSWFYCLYCLLFAILFVIFIWKQKTLVFLLSESLDLVKSMGIWGNAFLCLLFLLVSFPFILGGYLPLVFGAGSIYGINPTSILTVSIGSTLGAAIAFLVTQKFTRSWIERKLKGTKEFRFFSYILQEESKMVAIMARLAPIPFGLQNVFFALSEVPFRVFFFVTWLALLPLQLMWIQLGSTLRDLQRMTSGEIQWSSLQKLYFIVQIVIMVVLIVYFFLLSRKMKIREKQQFERSEGLIAEEV